MSRKGYPTDADSERAPDSPQESPASPSNNELTHAEQLYEKVKSLIQNGMPADESMASIIAELADDAVKEFGSTNQEKKVELRRIKEKAEEVLPPKTVEELKRRAEGQILKRTFPRNRTLRNVVLFIVGSGTILLGAYEVVEKYREAVGVKPRPQPSPISQFVNSSSQMSQAIDFNHQTTDHLMECEKCHGSFPRGAKPALRHLSIPGHNSCAGCHMAQFISLNMKRADPASGLRSVGMCFICHDEDALENSEEPKVKYGNKIPETLKIP